MPRQSTSLSFAQQWLANYMAQMDGIALESYLLPAARRAGIDERHLRRARLQLRISGFYTMNLLTEELTVWWTFRGRPLPEASSRLLQAQVWLQKYLARKPQLATSICRAAYAEGLSLRTLRRAKLALGVRSQFRGVGFLRQSYWSLPESDANSTRVDPS